MIPSAGAISLAIADANDKFLGKLSYVWEQVGCGETQATAAIARMMQNGIVDAVIGPDCEASCEPSAALTAAHNIPQISYSCSSDLLSDKKAYPTVAPNPDSRSPLLPPPLTARSVLVWAHRSVRTLSALCRF
jgi:ABC-type branched-subunit amino acid transport system substrate-binding protein